MTVDGKQLLINGVYSPAVGHVVEALMVASAYRMRASRIRIAVLLNRLTPGYLGMLLPNLRLDLIPVDTSRFTCASWSTSFFHNLGNHWKIVATLRDERDVSWNDLGLIEFHKAFKRSISSDRFVYLNDGTPRGLDVLKIAPLRFEIPKEAVRYAATRGSSGRPKILILTGSATYQKAPSVNFWQSLVARLLEDWPEGEIILMGSFNAVSGKTQNITQTELDQMLLRFPRCREIFSLGLIDQLAVAEGSDLLISPHSGMAFAVQCVGVPWLALSGWKNHEYLMNGVPFICIYPSCTRYPCDDRWGRSHQIMQQCTEAIETGSGPLLCLADKALNGRMDEICTAARALINKTVAYSDCLLNHYAVLERLGVDRSHIVNYATGA